MVKNTKVFVVSMLGACLLVGCSSETNSSSETKPNEYTVNFYDGENLLHTQTVQDGENLTKPDDPTKDGYAFKQWCTDEGLTEAYDFALPVNNDFSLYASFIANSFDGYNEEYLPAFSPLKASRDYYEGEKDAELTFESNSMLTLNDNITPNKIHLYGAFSNLEVTAAKVVDNKLSITTKGDLTRGTGCIALAKNTNDDGAYLTTSISVIGRSASLDPSSYRVVLGNNNNFIDFTIAMKNIVLNNENKLNKNDYINKVNAGEIKLFSTDLGDKYALSLIEVSDDFTAFRLRLKPQDPINEDLCKEILKGTIHINGEVLSSGISQDYHVDLINRTTTSTVKLYRYNATEYRGIFEVVFNGLRLTNTFKDHINQFVVDPKNKDFIVSIPNQSVTITSLSTPDGETHLKGTFKVAAENLDKGKANINLPEFTLDDNTVGHVAKNWFNDDDYMPQTESVDYIFDESALQGGGTGTVTQTAMQSYKNIKSEIEQNAFSGGSKEENDADKVINAATNLGMIGYGLYSGNYDSARMGASKLLGIDAIADPTTKILNSLANIYEELIRIEEKIDTIVDELDVIQKELEDLGQLALLENYLNALTAWKDFVTDYYNPLKNEVISYSNDYFRYFYNLVIDSYSPYTGKEPTITLNYDISGKLCFPSRNQALSIDGRIIDKSKTKTISIPQLNHCIAGVFENNGHVYSGIEDDFIVDLFSYNLYSKETIKDIIQTVRFNAMQNHFSDAKNLDSFTSKYANFCTALTSTEFGTSANTTITPLDCYRIMLETVYNFGFEIEPEFNLIVSKIESAYYCARSVLGFVNIINAGEIISTRYEELDKSVQKEFTDERFYHHNIDEHTVYCYATAGYVAWDRDAYGIAIKVTGNKDDGWDDHYYVNRADEYSPTNHDDPDEVESIDEANIRLMALKVRLYNDLKGTNYNLGEYLCSIGIIPQDKLEQTLGVVLKINGLEDDDDDVEDMTFSSAWKLDFDDRHYALAFKGKAFAFANGDTVNGLVGLTFNYLTSPFGDFGGIIDVTNVGYISTQDIYNSGVWAYYVNFYSVTPNQ